MEYTVYRVVVGRQFEDVDMDMCPIPGNEDFYTETMASKKEAIRQAQRHFDRQPLNSYVHQVWATVQTVTITDKGTTYGKVIYRKYKAEDTDIYGRRK